MYYFKSHVFFILRAWWGDPRSRCATYKAASITGRYYITNLDHCFQFSPDSPEPCYRTDTHQFYNFMWYLNTFNTFVCLSSNKRARCSFGAWCSTYLLKMETSETPLKSALKVHTHNCYYIKSMQHLTVDLCNPFKTYV